MLLLLLGRKLMKENVEDPEKVRLSSGRGDATDAILKDLECQFERYLANSENRVDAAQGANVIDGASGRRERGYRILVR